jgi:Asp-tRNA(Asn)/Glu-tRNA(Gln) amidotransferase A subunit family amidase
MMMKLAEATAQVDVYLAPPTPSIDTAVRGRGAAAGDGATGNGGRQNATLRHFNMANSAGYPAVSAPNGFTGKNTPTAMIFYGRPFAEAELLALVKAWQDASGFHLKHPTLDGAAPAQDSA